MKKNLKKMIAREQIAQSLQKRRIRRTKNQQKTRVEALNFTPEKMEGLLRLANNAKYYALHPIANKVIGFLISLKEDWPLAFDRCGGALLYEERGDKYYRSRYSNCGCDDEIEEVEIPRYYDLLVVSGMHVDVNIPVPLLNEEVGEKYFLSLPRTVPVVHNRDIKVPVNFYDEEISWKFKAIFSTQKSINLCLKYLAPGAFNAQG